METSTNFSSTPSSKQRDTLIQQFQSRTGKTRDFAEEFLSQNNWDLEKALKNAEKNSTDGWITFFYKKLFGDPEMRASENFINDFERQFGQIHPIVQPSFNQALSKSKNEFKFLLVYLHSQLHSDTEEFCRTVLCTPVLTEFVDSNFLFWMGSVSTSEGFKVSAELAASTFPFLAVICYNVKGEPTLVDTVEGTLGLHELLSQLEVVLERHRPSLQNLRNQRQQQEVNRNIIQEQDLAYQELLREDQERERRAMEEQQEMQRKQKEEEERQQKSLEEQQRQKEFQLKRRQQLKNSLPAEPQQTEKEITSLVFRLVNGSRLQRRFRASDKLQSVYDFLDSQENLELPSHFVLVTNFPRKVFNDKNITLQEAGLVPQSALFIEDLEKSD